MNARESATNRKICWTFSLDNRIVVAGPLVALPLRREGLYSSHLLSWRREHQAGILEVLKPRKRGLQSERNSLTKENEKRRREVGQ